MTRDSASQIVNDVPPSGVPHWFNVWALRAILAVVGVGGPLFMTAVYNVATQQLDAQREQTVEITKLGEQMATVQSTVASNAASVAHLRADISEIKLEITRIESTGILPLAEKRIDALQNSVRVIESKLSKVAPADVKAELESSVQLIVERLDQLENRHVE